MNESWPKIMDKTCVIKFKTLHEKNTHMGNDQIKSGKTLCLDEPRGLHKLQMKKSQNKQLFANLKLRWWKK